MIPHNTRTACVLAALALYAAGTIEAEGPSSASPPMPSPARQAKPSRKGYPHPTKGWRGAPKNRKRK